MSDNLPEIRKEQGPGTLELGGARMMFQTVSDPFFSQASGMKSKS